MDIVVPKRKLYRLVVKINLGLKMSKYSPVKKNVFLNKHHMEIGRAHV